MDFETAFGICPLVAILRGIAPKEAEAIGEVLVEAGFALIEVPLNSPDPLESISRLSRRFGEKAAIGAGTVLSTAAVSEVHQAGGRLIVMPHADVGVITAAKAAGMACVPGILTPSEAFAALAAGADALKLFPAELMPPQGVKAIRAVLPKQTRFLPVGGITPENMRPYLEVGVAGFGLGGALYRAGATAAQVHDRAVAFVKALARS